MQETTLSHTLTHTYKCRHTHAHPYAQMHRHSCQHSTHTYAYVHTHSLCTYTHTHKHTPSHCPLTIISHLHSLTTHNFMVPSPFLPKHPSLTSEHVLSSLFTHFVCTAPWHSVREERMVRLEKQKQRKKEAKEERNEEEGRTREEGKERGDMWRTDWLTSACKAIWPDDFSAHTTFAIKFTQLELMA